MHPVEAQVMAAAERCFKRGEHEGEAVAREAGLPVTETEWWLEKLERQGLVSQYLTDPESGDPHTHWVKRRARATGSPGG